MSDTPNRVTLSVGSKICRKCKAEKPLTDFGVWRYSQDGRKIYCRSCLVERQKDYAVRHPEAVSQRASSWNKMNPERRKFNSMRSALMIDFGMAIEDYELLLQNQNGLCLGCYKHHSQFKHRLQVDHDHATNKIRGLLCGPCNRTLGIVSENPMTLRRLADYLERMK